MSKRLLAVLAICLMASTAAHAQMGGGGRGGGGGGRGGRGGGQQTPPSTTSSSPPVAPDKPLVVSQLLFTGVITAIDTANERITINYEPVEAINWPAGTMPFVVAKSSLMKDIKVGEKVRFRLDNSQIAALVPYVAPPAEQ
jgi:hypothetical protein